MRNIFFCACLLPLSLVAQLTHPSNSNAFLQNEVAKIYITMNPQDFNTMVGDSSGASFEFLATFIYASSVVTDTIDTVGIRLRGNTSLQSAKKSFKIDFNVYQPGFKWYDLKSLNLNGEHNDVSIMRSRTCQEMLRWSGLPAARTSYVEVYINGEYKGLYINVEHLDDQYIEARFTNDDTGNLYKAKWGADMLYQGGGQAPYQALYELKTNEALNDFSGLVHFIDVLNNSSIAEFPCAIQEVIDVELLLNSLAFQILVGQWDGYTFNKNNYYLYQRPSDGKFVFLEYDLDNTFGVDWIGIDWQFRNIYTWSPSNTPRPLYTRMMQVPYFKDRFSYYIQQHINTYFTPGYMLPIWEATQALISPSALADTYKGLDYGFSDQDFLDAITDAWGNHVSTSLDTYITQRSAFATNQLIYNGLTNPCSVSLAEQHEEPLQWITRVDLLGRVLDEIPTNKMFIEISSTGQTRKRIVIP
ncbi:MAG: CotH kinase family protein [Flavobacteriales bacterium]|jgi:spore coat protein H